uniref:Uncharacterized protein n=1 Tax=Chromera velia CCMP2878 TaxID=1169474 RepID=A0A0G4HLN8_9ALVE|eukprot:Cvel_7380.t1-p1 / transcript=Cvel_7380.t1 / gene=Cvel_7380 / organism=Chromera_velia_CCMP2878 / gene_product=hypothetical protein / transcript_product=hypothetical protein / location=Cvel_scaffold384:44409-48370(-) / protein_length=460 / sequence_SO=supercontig / SO=protein_coding / is_pseudo=false
MLSHLFCRGRALNKLRDRKWRVALYDFLEPELDRLGLHIHESAVGKHEDKAAGGVVLSFTCQLEGKDSTPTGDEGKKGERGKREGGGKNLLDTSAIFGLDAALQRLTGIGSQAEVDGQVSARDRATRILSREPTENDWNGTFEQKGTRLKGSSVILCLSLTLGQWEAILSAETFVNLCRARVFHHMALQSLVQSQRGRRRRAWDLTFVEAAPEDFLPSVVRGEWSLRLTLTVGLPAFGENEQADRDATKSLFIALFKLRCWREQATTICPYASSTCLSSADIPADSFRGLLCKAQFFSNTNAASSHPSLVELYVRDDGWPVPRSVAEKGYEDALEQNTKFLWSKFLSQEGRQCRKLTEQKIRQSKKIKSEASAAASEQQEGLEGALQSDEELETDRFDTAAEAGDQIRTLTGEAVKIKEEAEGAWAPIVNSVKLEKNGPVGNGTVALAPSVFLPHHRSQK